MRTVLFGLVALSLSAASPALADHFTVVSAKAQPGALGGLMKERATIRFSTTAPKYMVEAATNRMAAAAMSKAPGAQFSTSSFLGKVKVTVVGSGAQAALPGLVRALKTAEQNYNKMQSAHDRRAHAEWIDQLRREAAPYAGDP